MNRRYLLALAVLGVSQAAIAHQAMEAVPSGAQTPAQAAYQQRAERPMQQAGRPAPQAREEAPRQSGGTRLSLGQQTQGQLAEGDSRLASGEYSDVYTMQARRGQTYTIRMNSSEFDPYLLVRGPGGLSVDNDDDPAGAGSLDSRLVFTAAEDGEVQIRATSYQSGETGRYALSLEAGGEATAQTAPGPGRGAPPPIVQTQPAPQQPRTPQVAQLVLGTPVAGTLLQGDRQRASGKYEDVFTFQGRRGETVELQLSSSDFDPFLVVNGPDGFSAFNDDDPQAQGSVNSRLVLSLPADGVYRVSATSFRSSEVGSYQLRAAPAPAGARPFTMPRAEPLSIGGSIRGSLDRQDEQLGRNKYVDRYRFTGRRGQRVSLELSSGAFDTYLTLSQPDGEELENDDTTGADGRPSLNSRIETVLPEDGQYTVAVSSYREGATGAYDLSVRPSNGSPRQARVQGGQRVFALMVGVSDYGGRTNNLPMTDQDATRLFESMRQSGVLHPSSVVLTNGQATREAVQAAFRRIAQQAGPDDLFLFFFSGHGDQIRAVEGASEVDGLSETIELRDAAMTDQEMVRLFGQLRTRMSMLVLDSCFSGGFEEVVNRPNIMALLSSEEDLTSEVAGRLGAGGYLSHYIRSGLSGDSDIDGDRMITAGEISTYLRRQFRTQGEIGATTNDRLQRNYQNLVIRRGGVQVDDVILRLGGGSLASAN
jgi:hypothetical protein